MTVEQTDENVTKLVNEILGLLDVDALMQIASEHIYADLRDPNNREAFEGEWERLGLGGDDD